MRRICALLAMYIIANSAFQANAQESELEVKERLHIAQMALGVLDGSIPVATSSVSKVGDVVIPATALRWMKLADSANIDITNQQRETFGKLISQYVRDAGRIRFEFKDYPTKVENLLDKLESDLVSNTGDVFLPFQKAELLQRRLIAEGLPSALMRNSANPDIDLDDEQRSEIAESAKDIAKQLDRAIVEAKQKAIEDFVDSLPPAKREALLESVDLEQYKEDIATKLPAEILVFQLKSIGKK